MAHRAFQIVILYISLELGMSVKYVRHSPNPARLAKPFRSIQDVSLLTCSTICTYQDGCFGVNHHHKDEQCELLNKTGYLGDYSTETDGWSVYSDITNKIFTPCSVAEDCLDRNSRCTQTGLSSPTMMCYCKPLFEYQRLKRRCEKVCTSFGSDFTRRTDVRIFEHNLQFLYMTLAHCKQECLNRGNNCPSIDYLSTGVSCRLNSISEQTAIDAGYLQVFTGDNVYIRHCEN